MEPPRKRPRVGNAPQFQGADDEPDEDGDELNFQPHEISQMRDPDYQLAKRREAVGNRFQTAMSNIFEKYGRDFGDAGDEIDFETGEVVVDNGHLANMRYDGDIGTPAEWEEQEGEDDEEEGIRLEDMPDDWGDSSGAAGEGHGHQNINDEAMTTLTSLAIPRDSGFGPNFMPAPVSVGGLPWNMGPRLYYPGPGPLNTAPPAFFNGPQPPNLSSQTAWGSQLPLQVPPFGPSTGFYPPLPGDYGFGVTSLSSKKTGRRIQRSQFTSRFRTKDTVPSGIDDAGNEPIGEKGSSAKDTVQGDPPRAESGQLVDEADELNFEQLFHTFITEDPIDDEEPPQTPAVSPPAESDLGENLTETLNASKSVVVELPEMVSKSKEQYTHIRQNKLYEAALTPPKSLVDVSDSDGEQHTVSDKESVQSENDPSHIAAESLPARTEIVSPERDSSSPGIEERSELDGQVESPDSDGDSEVENDLGKNDQTCAESDHAERLGSIELGEDVTVPQKSPRALEIPKERVMPSPIEAQDSHSQPRLTPTAKRHTSRKPAPPTNTRTLEHHLTQVTKPQSRTTAKATSPAIRKSPKKQVPTPSKETDTPLTPRHRDLATATRTPSSRRSILSLLSDEEDDEILLSEKHAVSIPSLFNSSRRKKWKSRADLAKSNYQTPTKKRTWRRPPATAESSVKPGVCGVDGYTCGKDFCFTCL